MKRLFITISFIVLTITNGLCGSHYYFSSVCSSGQTLYYLKLSSNTVCVTYPNDGNLSHTYDGYNKPTGNIIIPETVSFDGVTYSVTRIFSGTFANCSEINAIFIPNSVTSIDYNAFDNISISYYCAAEKRPDGWWGLSGGTTFFNTKLNGDFAYRVTNNELLEAEIIGYLGTDNNIDIPSEIAINAYTKCKVTNIAANAFRNHTNMTGIIIPYTVKSIGGSAFYGCTGLTSIVLPISLTSIGDGAFTNCYNIESMNIKCLTPPTINSQTFLSVDKNIPVFVTCGNANTYKSTDYWRDFVTFIDNEIPFTIEANSDDESMGNVTIRQQPTCSNTNAIIEATCTNGFIFSHWNDGNTENPRTIAVTQDSVLTAFFEKNVTANISSSDNVMGYTSNNTTFFKYGETITVSAEANYGYHFTQWSDGVTTNPRTLTLTGDVAFQAQFAINQYRVTLLSNNPARGSVSGSGTFNYNTTNTLTATAYPDYKFYKWSDGNTDNPRQLLLTSDTVLTATFVEDRLYEVNVVSQNTNIGTVSGAGKYDYGTSITLQATPTANCYFVGWSDGQTMNPRSLLVESDVNLIAEFDTLQIFNILVQASDTLCGIVEGSGRFVSGTEATLSATANEHYYFSQWSDGRTDNPRRVRVIADATYTAVFEPEQYSVTLSQNNADMGMVSGSGQYRYGDMVSCLAKPYQNYHFVQWSNGSTANPYEFVIESNQLLTAYFAAGAVTGIEDGAATEPIIYAVGKTIVVENAADEILVYDAMGRLIGRDVARNVCTISINNSGVYVVKIGNVVKRVAVE